MLLAVLVSGWSLDSLIAAVHRTPAFESLSLRRSALLERAYQYGRMENPVLSMEREEGNFGIFLEQELMNPVKLKNERKLWKGEWELLDARIKSDSFALIIRVKELYWKAIYTEELMEITRRTIFRLDSIKGMVEKGYLEGRFPLTHVLAMESRLNHYASTFEMLKERYDGYMEHISMLLGVRVDAVEGNLEAPTIPDLKSIPVDSAIPVMVAGASSRIARYRGEIAGNSLWKISIYAGVWNDPYSGNRWYSTGFSLPLPIFDNLKGESMYWRGMSESYRMDSIFAVRRVKGLLHEFRSGADALLSKLKTVEKLEIPLARRMYQESLRNYMKGGSTYLEVLDALEVLHGKEVERADYIMELLDMCMKLEVIIGRCIRR